MERRINIKNRERRVQSKSTLELSDISNNWLFKIFAIAISVVLLYSVNNSIKLTLQKLEILEKAKKEVEELRVSNLSLSIEIKDMSTDKYLEKEARDRLNFGGKNEILFVIPSNALELAEKRVESIIYSPKAKVHQNGDNITEWLDFILLGI